jgi:general secretion pathway protein L
MSLLLILLPARPRSGGRAGAREAAAGQARVDTELGYLFSADGRTLGRSGTAPVAMLPRADQVVAVVPPAEISWHRLPIPKAPAARLRAALAGALEEQLLEEEEQLHFALGAGARPGQTGWVAVLNRPWLAGWLGVLEGSGLAVERVLPALRPREPGQGGWGHVVVEGQDDRGAVVSSGGDFVAGEGAAVASGLPPGQAVGPALWLAREDGVVRVRLGGGLASAWAAAPERAAGAAAGGVGAAAGASAAALAVPSDLPGAGPAMPAAPVRWTATPAAAAAAEAWLGAPVALLGEEERLLALAGERDPLAASGTQGAAGGEAVGVAADNLRQFDLAAQRRGPRALRDVARRLAGPAWRPVRWGVAVLVVLQLVGLNAHAWQQRQALGERRAAMAQLLRDTHPGVRAVLDAPLQMVRENERLRAAAGRAGDADLEALLGAAAAAWPDGGAPVQTLRYDGTTLTLATPGWSDDDVARFRQRLQGSAYQVAAVPGQVSLSRAPERGTS